jgi:hypothetical protein
VLRDAKISGERKLELCADVVRIATTHARITHPTPLENTSGRVEQAPRASGSKKIPGKEDKHHTNEAGLLTATSRCHGKLAALKTRPPSLSFPPVFPPLSPLFRPLFTSPPLAFSTCFFVSFFRFFFRFF